MSMTILNEEYILIITHELKSKDYNINTNVEKL